MKIDYEITVDVSGADVETKKRVQDAFFKLGIKWRFGGDSHLYLEENLYTNMHDSGGVINYLMWCDSSFRKPTHTINQLFELAGMETESEPGMIPFNLEKALAGDPVITRDGREVTQITLFECDDKYPLVAVINGEVYSFTKRGEYVTDHRLENFDLFMKPKTRVINDFEVPAPESEPLEEGDKYYISSIQGEHFYRYHTWSGDHIERRWLKRGLVFLTKEDAIANAKAMLGINPYGIVMSKYKRILSGDDILTLAERYFSFDVEVYYKEVRSFAERLEQAVLQSEQVQALRKDAERYRYLKKGNQWIVAATQTGWHVDGGELDEIIDSELEEVRDV